MRPVDLGLGQAVVLHQPVVALLHIPGSHVQLLIQFGVLIVHLTQQLHLFGQVLMHKRKGNFSILLLIRYS